MGQSIAQGDNQAIAQGRNQVKGQQGLMGQSIAILLIALSLLVSPVHAQTNGPLDLTTPGTGTPPPAESSAAEPDQTGSFILQLQAQLHADGPLVPDGLIWRVFKADDTQAEPDALIVEKGGSIALALPPETYIIHASFGLASAIKKVRVERNNQSETIDLNAGGMQLSSVVGDGRPINTSHISFDIYSERDQTGNRSLLQQKTAFNQVVRLNAGTYHVVSRYGEANAIVRADIRVRPGKLTNATIIHRAAMITLKFVNEPGGEALANTIWTVLTPGGDTVAENVGAFPTMILAEGDYTAIAKHEGEIFNRNFSVEAGVNRDVEVLFTKLERQ